MNYNDIHIGSRIQQVMKDQGRNVSWFAKQICFERSNVYKMFKRKSIDTDLLTKAITAHKIAITVRGQMWM